VRLHSIFRIREHVRVLVQKVRRVTVFLLVLGVLFSSLVVGKNVFLGEVRKEIRKSFAYDSLTASYFPPALVFENVRSLAGPPTFRARRIRVEVPYLSLLRNRKVLSVTLDSPELRLAPAAPGAPRPKAGRPRSAFSLPFVIERGLVEDGSVSFETGAATVEVRGLRALVTQSGEEFSVRATAARSGYSSPAQNLDFGGALTVLLSGRGEAVKIDRLTVEGPDVTLQVEGSIRNFLDPEVDLAARFDIETAFLDAALRLPFEWKGKIGGEGKLRRRSGELAFETSLASDAMVLCGVPMGRIRGRFDLAPATGGRIDLAIQKPGLPAESLSLTFLQGRVEGRAAPIFVDPVFRELKIPWPVRSPAWGTFALENRKLAVDAEFRDPSLAREGDLFSFRGGAKVGVDFATHNVSIRTPGLETNFGRLEASAAIDLAGDIDARIRGQVFDVKQTREFVSLVLNETFGFGEIRGAGYADVRLSAKSASPIVSLKATLSPGGFDLFDAAFVETEAVISGGGFEGSFDIDDPELKGRVRVKTDGDTLEVDVKDGEGELAKILPALEVPVSLSGRASGDFRMVQKAGGQEFSGTFTSPEITGYNEKAGRVSGRLEWKDGILTFPELAMDFYGGRFNGRLLVGTVNGEFDFDLRGEELDFRQVVSAASGRLSLALTGRGVFGRDKLGGLFSIKDMVLSPLEKTEARGDLQLDVAGGHVLLGLKGGLVPGENPFEAAFDFPLSGGLFSGIVKGRIGDLDLIWPWYGAQGRADYTADVKETETKARVTVAIEAVAPVMPLPGFAYAMTDFTASANYLDDVLSITSLGGKLGGGDVRGSGEVGIGDIGIATMDLRLEAKDMVLSPMERMRAQADGTLRLLKDKKRFVTEGELLFKRLTWRREIYEEFGFSSEAEPKADTGPSFFDGMSLNIRLRADENMVIENSLGKFNGRFNLTATGAFDSPVLLGDIDLTSGDFYFQDRSFRVINGRLSFVDPVNTEPHLDFRGETYVKDYRVTLSMSGPVSRLKPEFSSSPPLPPEEILSLLALGEAFKRTYYSYSGDRSTAMNTASLLTYQIADQAKKRTGGLLSLDRFRVDPYIPESAPGGIAARITVGKKISRNLLFLYSTILANSTVMAGIDEVPIFRMEWDISRKFSLVGGRDDRGRLSLDVKYRKRF
jgi:autotransporter translocation and assembly factor TamB